MKPPKSRAGSYRVVPIRRVYVDHLRFVVALGERIAAEHLKGNAQNRNSDAAKALNLRLYAGIVQW